MKKLTKKILTGLTAASIAGVALLPTSAAATDQTFTMNLEAQITPALRSLFAGNVVIADDQTASTNLGSFRSGEVILSRELITDFIRNTSTTTAHHVDISIDGDPNLIITGGGTDHLAASFTVNGHTLSATTPLTNLEIPANGTFNLAHANITTAGATSGTYHSNLRIVVAEH